MGSAEILAAGRALYLGVWLDLPKAALAGVGLDLALAAATLTALYVTFRR